MVYSVSRQWHSHLSHFTFKTKVLHLSLRFFCNYCNNHWNTERTLLFLGYCIVGLTYTLNVLECNCNFYALHYELSHITVSGQMPLSTMELVWPRSSAELDPKSQYLHGRPLCAIGFQLHVKGGKKITLRTIRPWKRLPREAVDLALAHFQNLTEESPGQPGLHSVLSLLLAGSWAGWPAEVASNLRYSVVWGWIF